MQNAKDTVYEALRSRLAAVNPDRTVVVRGAARPAIVVAENELAAETLPLDCFVLSWSDASVDAAASSVRVTLTCKVSYATSGSAENSGMDRGRTLAAMDAELATIVNALPQSATKVDYSGDAPTEMATQIWWGDIALGAISIDGARIGRTATFSVMAYQRAGEL